MNHTFGQLVARAAGALGGLVLLMVFGSFSWASQRFPPPQFESDHTMPTTTAPPPDALWREFVDVAILATALGVAAYLVLVRRRRKAVLALVVLSLIYFGFWRQGCICAIGAIQNVTLALADGGYALPLVAGIFFLLPLLATVLFGRVFCAGVCPIGAIQDVVAIKPLRVPLWLDHSLALLAYLYLGAAVLLAATGSAWIICQYDPFVGLFRMSGTTIMLVTGGLFLVAGMFLARPYCRWLCPYGVVMSWIAPGAVWQPRIATSACTRCRLCSDGCPVNAIELPDEGPWPANERRRDRRRMLLLVLLVPLLAGAGTALGAWAAPMVARADQRVRLAERLASEQMGWVAGHTDATASFRARGDSFAELQAEVESLQVKFYRGTSILGGFMGLVVACKLVKHARRPRREEFSIDQARCLACARCFSLCPHHPEKESMLGRSDSTEEVRT